MATKTTIETRRNPNGGLFGSLGSAVKDLVKETERVLDVTFENHPIFDDGRGPQRLFEKFGVSEILLGEFSCRAMNSNDLLSGEIYITPSNLYFSASWRNPNGIDSLIKVTLPYHAITNIQQAGHVPSVNPRVPAIVPLNINAQIKPTVIQIFTTDKLVHQFLGFGDAYYKAWNIFSYAWRTFHNKPHPDNTPPPYLLQPVQQTPGVPTMQQTVLTPTQWPPVQTIQQINVQQTPNPQGAPINKPMTSKGLDPPLEPQKLYPQVSGNNNNK